jgi:hypothetical protein
MEKLAKSKNSTIPARIITNFLGLFRSDREDCKLPRKVDSYLLDLWYRFMPTAVLMNLQIFVSNEEGTTFFTRILQRR